MHQAELKVVSGKHVGSVIPLPQGKFLVGREEDCHLRPNSDLVSRHHCVFTVDEFAVRVRDLGSTNGTLVNGERISGGVMLQAGDIVSIGKIEFEVALHEGPQDTETQMAISSDTHFSQPEVSPTKAEESSASQEAAEQESAASQTIHDLTQIPVGAPVGETQYLPPQAPPGMGYPPGMPGMGYPPGMPPMGYPPQMMPPYGYPGYPPMGYPQQMGYPLPGIPAQPQAAPPADSGSGSAHDLPLRLPEPGETGAKEAPPPEKKKPDDASSQKPGETVSDVINKYRNRRPGT